MLGTGTRVVSTEKLHRQGNMISTENSLDVAISGDSFAVQQATEQSLTQGMARSKYRTRGYW